MFGLTETEILYNQFHEVVKTCAIINTTDPEKDKNLCITVVGSLHTNFIGFLRKSRLFMVASNIAREKGIPREEIINQMAYAYFNYHAVVPEIRPPWLDFVTCKTETLPWKEIND